MLQEGLGRRRGEVESHSLPRGSGVRATPGWAACPYEQGRAGDLTAEVGQVVISNSV